MICTPGHWTGGVDGLDPISQLGRRGHSRAGDLVANAPHNDARMVTIAASVGLNVPLTPLIEIDMVVVRRILSGFPDVESLIHDQHAQTIGHLQKLWGGRVVRGSDPIASHALQNLDLAFDSATIDCRAQSAKVMVHTVSPDLYGLVVEVETGVGIEFCPAKTDGDGIGIHRLVTNQ